MKKLPLLIDFDGVIKIGNEPAKDASPFLSFIIQNKIPALILSNSTLKTSKVLHEFLAGHNLEFDIPALTAADATLNYVRNNYKKVSVYCTEIIKNIFNDFIDDKHPEAVIIGDLGENWNYEIMNEIFRKVQNGADIIAMQKNKFWLPDGKTITMDAGAFISAIEFASSKKAVVIGKPSKIYFKAALKYLDFPEDSSFMMIGDDLENDIKAAKNNGGKGILVFTGKTKFPLPENLKNIPDYEAKDLTDAKVILEKIYS